LPNTSAFVTRKYVVTSRIFLRHAANIEGIHKLRDFTKGKRLKFRILKQTIYRKFIKSFYQFSMFRR